MQTPKFTEPAKSAILAIAEIKAAVAAFDRGEVNVFEALDAVRAAGAALPAAVLRMHRVPTRHRRRAA